MESWCSKHNSPLLILIMMLLILMVEVQIQAGVCIENEKAALLEIKDSLIHEFPYNFLSTWVDDGITGGDCCNWDRIKCDATTGHITSLSLSNVFSMAYDDPYVYIVRQKKFWSLNFSPFLRFKELRSLDLSHNFIGNTIVSTGLERLSSLNKLEKLNLSNNHIEHNIFPLLVEITSLKVLDLNYINNGVPATPHDIPDFSNLENLEVLNLMGCRFYGTLQIQELSCLTNLKELDLSYNKLNVTPSIRDCKSLMRLERLESISLGGHNNFNKSIISCLSFLPSLKILDLSYSYGNLGSSVPMQELSSLKELTTLDLSDCSFESLPILNSTMSNLKHLNLDENHFDGDVMMSIMVAFPSLRFLSLNHAIEEGKLFDGGVPNFPYLEALLLNSNGFNGTLPMEDMTSFPRLKVLDLSYNNFVGSIPPINNSLSSLKVVSFAENALDGSLDNNAGLCELKNLHELDLSYNMLVGNLPECFKRLTSLKMLDISSNQFTGTLLPSLISNLTFLEYVDFGHNKFEGSFSLSSLSNHTKLRVFQFERENEQFDVETEEPFGWIPMFQLKSLVLSNGNIKRLKGSVVPSFLLHQHQLQVLDLSHNCLEGQFPNWLLKNNTKLKVLKLRNNSLHGVMRMEYLNPNMMLLDMSGNHMITGSIPQDIQKFIPFISYLNFSNNLLNGVIPSSTSDLCRLDTLDLSYNKLSGKVPKGLLTNIFSLQVLKLSGNTLHGHILSGNFSLIMDTLCLDNNHFTGNIGNNSAEYPLLSMLDISYNMFTGSIPSWIGNLYGYEVQLVARNNNLEGRFPCGQAGFLFLDISHNFFSGPIPSCLNLRRMEHLHLGSNRFIGSVPNAFRNLTKVLTLDIGHNKVSGKIPKFLGDLSKLRILLLGKNNFSGHIPKQLCKLTDVNYMDLSSNSLSGLIPSCLQYNNRPKQLVFTQHMLLSLPRLINTYGSALPHYYIVEDMVRGVAQDEAQFTTKKNSLTYKGKILDYMSGLDLSCNKLTGEIPQELGKLTQILVLNLSQNKFTGPIPVNLSNLIQIESLDLSFNGLTGNVPSELTQLNRLAVFNVSYNNLSGRLPELKAQFATFTEESYEGNPLLCGPPLENKCITETQVTHPSDVEGTNEKWYDMDATSFYGSSGATWFVFMLGFATLLYINPYWRRMWLELVEECHGTGNGSAAANGSQVEN